MRKRANKIITTLLVVFCLTISTFAINIFASNSDTKSTGLQVLKKQYTNVEEVKSFINGDDTAPEEEGYLFAGWYTDADCTKENVIQTADGVPSTGAYARFVPKQVLGIKAQTGSYLIDDVVDAKDNSAPIRFITSVDSLAYSQIGMHIKYTTTEGVKEFDTPEKTNKIVYTSLKVMAEGLPSTVNPADTFCALSTYFKAHTIKGVPASAYTDGFTITPYWITMDGTRVNGDSRTLTIDEGCIRQNAWIDTVNGSDVCYNGSQSAPYKTLAYAMAKANKVQKDATITLASNVDVPENLSINNENGNSITIDGGSSQYTMTTGAYNHAFCINGTGAVDFKNTTMKAKNWGALVRVNTGATIDFTDVTVDATEPVKTDKTDNGYQYALINTLNGADTVTNLNFTRVNVTMADTARDNKDNNKAILRTGNGDVNKTVNVTMTDCTWDTTEATTRSGIVIMGKTTSKLTLTDTTIRTRDALPIKDWTNSAQITKASYSEEITHGKARIDVNVYTTLKGAVDTANTFTKDVTITLLNNVDVPEDLSINNANGKAITIDGGSNKYTMTTGAYNHAFCINGTGTVNFKNMTMKAKNWGALVRDNTGATVNFTDVYVDATEPGNTTNGYQWSLFNVLTDADKTTTLNFTRTDITMKDNANKNTNKGIIRTGNGDVNKTVNISLTDCTWDTMQATGRSGIVIQPLTTTKLTLKDATIKTKDAAPILDLTGNAVIEKTNYTAEMTDAQAKIGDEFYLNFASALTAANTATSDVIITLLKNATVAENASVNNASGKAITIDGGSNKYTLATGTYNHALCINGTGTVNFKNMTMQAKSWGTMVRVNTGATLNFTDVEIDATAPGSADNGYLYALINTLNGENTVTNLNFTRTNVTMKDGARSDSNKAIVRSGNGDVNKTVNISLDGCTWDTTQATGRSGIVIMGKTTSNITLKNSTIKTKDALPIKDWTNKATITKNNYNVSVDDTNIVAGVGANSYSSLSAAVSNANGYAHNITIELLNNSTTSAQCAIRNDDEVMYTIDGNGKTITAQGGGNFLRIEDIAKCDVTIKDLVINFKNTGAAIQVADNTKVDIEVNVTDVDINANYTGMGTTTCNYALINLAAPSVTTTLNMTNVNVDMITTTAGAEQTTAGIIRTGNANVAKTVNVNLVNCDLDATGAVKRQGIIIMNNTTSVVSMENTNIKVTDGMYAIYRQKDDATTSEIIEATRVMMKGTCVLQAGTSTALADTIVNIDSSMVQENTVYQHRVVMISDPHYTAQNPSASENASGASGSILGYTQKQRMDIIAQDMNNFLKKNHVNRILVLGDLSTDDCGVRNLSKNYVEAFRDDCMSQVDVQWNTIAGNHDAYTSDQWKNIFGYGRQYSFVVANAAFIMMDTYQEGTITNTSGADYKGIDFTWLNTEIAKYPDKKIFLCAHYVNPADMETIREMTKTNDQLVAVFDAHTHLNHATRLGTDMNEFHVNIGDYSYKAVKISDGEYDFNQFDSAYAWGYQVLEWNDTEAHVYHVKPARTYTGSNGTFNYAGAIEGEKVIKYQ